MAKTKRRSCKGGRKSRRCRGGLPKPRGYNDPYYANGKKAESGFRLAEPTSNWNPFSGIFKKLTPDPRQTIPDMSMSEMLRRQYGDIEDRFHYATKPLMRTASAVRASASRLSASAKNAADRLIASTLRAFGVHSDYLDENKLVPVTQDMLSGYEQYDQGLVIKPYYYTSDGKFYNSLHRAGPVGIWPDRSNIMTAQFLSGHEPKPGQSWAITRLRI